MRKTILTRFRSIRTSIIASFSLLIVFALLTFLMISLQYTKNAVLENSGEYTSQLIGQVNSDIDSYLTYMENISYIVSRNTDVGEFLFANEKQTDEAERRQLAERVSAVLRTISDTREDITNIGILSESGRYALNRGSDKLNPYISLGDLSWYQDALAAAGKATISSSHVQNLVAGRYDWVVTLSRRITSQQETNAAAVFFVDLNYDSINSLCENINLGNKGYVFILDQNGGVIYHPQQQLLYSGLKEERIQEVMESEDTSFVTEDQYLYTISRSDYSGWTVVGVAYVPELLMEANRAQRLYVLTALLLFTIALALAVLLSDAVTRPVKSLEDSMKEVEKGNFVPTTVAIEEKNEIGRLSRSFNMMIEEIQKLMKQTEREQQEKRRSELKALQNQMTPHFLYNTLDSIIWMAEWGKNQEVVLMTSSLAQLLRRSISNDKEVVTIGEEAAYTESYLTIQKLRYKNKLEYEIDMEEGILSCEIMKLVLQPLVENAIYHGIKYKEGKGTIRVRGRREGDCICLQVEDDGNGMDGDTLEHIFEKHAQDTKSNGVGLNNVRERLRFYYGAKSELSFESSPGVGTTATVRIPAEKEELHGET